MQELITDFSQFTEKQMTEMCDELKTGHMKRMVDAEVRQRQIAQENQQDHRAVDGVGRLVARFDLDGYMSTQARLGVDPRDPEYIKWAMKRHPECRVNSGGTKIQVGYNG